MNAIIMFAIVFSLNASASNYVELPFDPAYAADQKEITFDSLGGEISQFQQMSNWHNMLGNIKNKKLERDQLKKAYERGKTLVSTGAITREEFERREFVYQMSEGSVREMEARAQMARISVESTKMTMIMQGDSSKDLRRDMAQNMKKSLEAQFDALKAGSENAALNEAYQSKLAAIAEDLYRKKVITETEYDRRKQDHESAKNQVDVLAHQKDVIGKALAGIERSLQRLFGH